MDLTAASAVAPSIEPSADKRSRRSLPTIVIAATDQLPPPPIRALTGY
jgi:hypothetical protein